MRKTINAQQIRNARKRANITQAQLAYELGVAPSTVYLWEKEGRGLKEGTTSYALHAFFEKALGANWQN